MSDSFRGASSLRAEDWARFGAYESPFSGTGMEFLPLGVRPEEGEIALHEVGFLPRRPHWNYANVFSPYWRLYYDFRPGHAVVFPHREVPLGPDRFVLIPAHQTFNLSGTAPRPHFWMAFSYSDHPMPGQGVPFELRPRKIEGRLVRELRALLVRKASERNVIYHNALALLHLLVSRPEIRWQPTAPQALLDVIQYMEHHHTDRIYIQDLARIANMSESAFRRAFHRIRNVSPGHFLTQLRVRSAAHLLATTSLELSLVAERSGFPNCSYFSRVYKSVTGESPSQFRKRAISWLPAGGRESPRTGSPAPNLGEPV
jgi:AraC-like DNA-binding protein